MSIATKNFRYDINGLRAWAVIFVALYHFGIPGFSGGFVGVDIFFVISGFLMVSIIISSLEGKQTTLANALCAFYASRAKRIVPALLVLCSVLLIIGFFALAPADYQRLGTHVAFSLTFLSNIRYLRESGYFDTDSLDKWLLHTWSLSVEWQFYLALPLVLMLLWRVLPGRRAPIVAISLCFTALLLYSIAVTQINTSRAFYLLPTRAWELLAGSLTFLLANKWQLTMVKRRTLDVLGFALIILSVAKANATLDWPGYWALVPVTGTVLMLYAARQSSTLTRHSILQFVGKCSYSIYLWHWPLVVALFYLGLKKNDAAVTLGILLSILFGWLSYMYVENPVRRVNSGARPLRFLVCLSVFVSAVAASSIYVNLSKGVPGRLPQPVEIASQEQNNYNHRRDECHSLPGREFKRCNYGGQNIKAILIGDSQASAVASAVQAAAPANGDGILAFSYSACPTMFHLQRDEMNYRCAEFNEWVLKQIDQIPDNIPIVIVNRLTAYALGNQYREKPDYGVPYIFFHHKYQKATNGFLDEFKTELVQSLCRIAALRPTFIAGPLPEMLVDTPKAMARNLILDNGQDVFITLAEYYDRHRFTLSVLESARSTCGINILDPVPWLCPNGHCMGDDGKRPLYYDAIHLSEFGNKKLVPMFATVFSNSRAN